MDDTTIDRIRHGAGFVAALDQSGGSTPGALRLYGVADSDYAGEDEMFALMHEMRVRIMSSPAFTGEKIMGAILFEQTMDGVAHDMPVPTFLRQRGIVPFLKVDRGLEPERDGVSLMKPMLSLDALLTRALALGMAGTKMRSTIARASRTGIAAIVDQQFEVAAHIAGRDLMPIVEPEILLKSPEREAAETLLRAELLRRLDALPPGRQVMLKLTLPVVPDFYRGFTQHPAVARVVALSGGYSRTEACRHLAANHGVIASFSRALTEGLYRSMSDAAFDAALAASIDEIRQASLQKT